MSTRKTSKKKDDAATEPQKPKRGRKPKAPAAGSDSVPQESSPAESEPLFADSESAPTESSPVPVMAVFDSGLLRELDESLRDIEASAPDPLAMTLSKRQATLMRVDSLRRIMLGQGESARPLVDRADALTQAIRRADEEQFVILRDRVSKGEYGPDDLRTDLFRMTPFEWNAFVARLFDIATPPERRIARQEEMVDYVPTPVLSVLELASSLTENDVLYDIGSGLGLVVLLSAWLSRAHAVGVEVEPSFVEIAEARARAFRIDRASFVTADARAFDLSNASVIYLYYPARGALLDQILARIREASQKHPIRIYSNGRSSQALAESGFAKSPVVFPSGMVRFLAGE